MVAPSRAAMARATSTVGASLDIEHARIVWSPLSRASQSGLALGNAACMAASILTSSVTSVCCTVAVWVAGATAAPIGVGL
jgi:hypothetical protein